MSDGAAPSELLIEAVRRNNVDLLNELLQDLNTEQTKDLINEARDPVGNTALHVATINGSCK